MASARKSLKKAGVGKASQSGEKASRPVREGNRKRALMDAAARLFAHQGYRATTIRDIASAVEMLPGSVYYHFPSKELLLLAIYLEAVERTSARIGEAIAALDDPWARLEAATTVHLETILDASAYAKVMVRVLPEDAAEISAELTQARDDYEGRFRDLIAALDLPAGVSPGILRLMMLGALNWAQVWYRRGGKAPADIAHNFLQVLRNGAME